MPLFYRHQTDGGCQLVARHCEYCRRRIDCIKLKWIADLFFDRILGIGKGISCLGYTRKPGDIDTTKYKVGIGDSRFGAPTPVTDRTGLRARTFGANPKQSGRINPRNRTATCAYCVDVDHWNTHRYSVGEVFFCRQRWCCPDDHTDIKAGSSHIAGNEIIETALLSDVCRGDSTRRRTGHHGLYWLSRSCRRCQGATVALHD